MYLASFVFLSFNHTLSRYHHEISLYSLKHACLWISDNFTSNSRVDGLIHIDREQCFFSVITESHSGWVAPACQCFCVNVWHGWADGISVHCIFAHNELLSIISEKPNTKTRAILFDTLYKRMPVQISLTRSLWWRHFGFVSLQD